MYAYIYAYKAVREYGEVFLKFPAVPEIITSLSEEEYGSASSEYLDQFCHDAVVTALQSHISYREPIPESNHPGRVEAEGFVRLNVIESMKLQLYDVYLTNCKSVGELAEKIGRQPTAASRLLNLRHNSVPKEIEDALGKFGKELNHEWGLAQKHQSVMAAS